LPIITWQNPAPIYYPTPLSALQLNATSAGVAGTWTYTPALGTILNPGTYTLRVLFSPTNGVLYLVNTASVTLRVLERAKSNPVIRWADPLPIFEPTALSALQLTAVCSVPGKLIYTPALGTILQAGVYALHVECDPTEEEKYNSISYAVRLVVNKGSAGGLTPVVPPAPSTPTKKPTTPVEPAKGPQNPNPNIIVPVETSTSSMVVTYPETPGVGIKAASIENNNLVSSPEPTFSGRTTVSVTLVNNGETQTILVPVVVLPAAAVSPVAQPNTFVQGQVQWTPVENATGYQVSIRGKVVCQTNETTCSVPQTVGPATPVTVTSLGNDNTANPALAAVVVPKALPALVVHFATNSATLTSDDRSQLRQVAKAIKSEGFTQVILQGHTDSVGGVDNNALSKARAASTQSYLGKLVPGLTFTSAALADKSPVAPNSTDAGKAQNRRTEVLVR
jgi:outer membrane protein OmpA-like peptidoglycan-associated protein